MFAGVSSALYSLDDAAFGGGLSAIFSSGAALLFLLVLVFVLTDAPLVLLAVSGVRAAL